MTAIRHLKVDLWASGAAVCGQAGNPWVVWALPYSVEWPRIRRQVTCKKCRRAMKRTRR